METYDLDICVDCLVWLANGDLPEDRPELPQDIEIRWPARERWHLVPAGGEDDEPHFSWSPCECCGSQLGGDRHKAAAWRREE